MTINELYKMCADQIEQGNGDRIVLKKQWHLGNSHQDMEGKMTLMEDANTTISKRMRKAYIELR